MYPGFGALESCLLRSVPNLSACLERYSYERQTATSCACCLLVTVDAEPRFGPRPEAVVTWPSFEPASRAVAVCESPVVLRDRRASRRLAGRVRVVLRRHLVHRGESRTAAAAAFRICKHGHVLSPFLDSTSLVAEGNLQTMNHRQVALHKNCNFQKRKVPPTLKD